MSGVELTRKSLDFVNGTVRPLGDRILVKPLPLKLSTLIEAAWKGKTVRGTVVAVGPGEYPNKYNKDRSKVWKSRIFRKTEVKVGDEVELGGMEIGGYEFVKLIVNGVEMVLCSEKDVAAVHDV